MIVVADTAPINYLIQIGEVDLLKQLYGAVVLPEAVRQELLANGSPAPVKTWLVAGPDWISVVKAEPTELDLVSPELDPGEREAIAIALRVSADLLIVDDRAGRREATRLHLPFTGTLGILLAGSQRGLVNLSQAIGRLRATSCFLPEAVIRDLLARIER